MNMSYIKIGLIISTFFILLSIVFLQYDIIEVSTIRDVVIVPAFIINTALIFKIFKTKKNNC